MTTDIDCNCDVPEESRLGPCPTHNPDTYRTWITNKAPRLAAAEAASDPFIERLSQQFPDACDIPEFDAYRKSLSEDAVQLFDKDWENGLSEAWPDQWELALKIRDDWQALVLPQERQALRVTVTHSSGADEYPFSEDESSPYSRDLDTVRTPTELLEEADQLAKFITEARQLERMLRDHAAGGTLRADQI